MDVKRPISMPSLAPRDSAYIGRKGVITLALVFTMNVVMARMTTRTMALIFAHVPYAGSVGNTPPRRLLTTSPPVAAEKKAKPYYPILSILTNMQPIEPIIFKDRTTWRSWLEGNHSDRDEVWVFHFKKGSSKKGLTHEEAVEEALCFGWIDSRLVRVDEEKYALRYTPRKPDSVWSKINKEKADRMIRAGKMTSAGLAKIEEAKRSGSWQKAYTNIKRDRIPTDLKKALQMDERAWSNFQNFANSYTNMYIGWVTSSKTNETRRKRIAKVVEQSINNKKLLLL